jgi:hypothetical protein
MAAIDSRIVEQHVIPKATAVNILENRVAFEGLTEKVPFFPSGLYVYFNYLVTGKTLRALYRPSSMGGV